MPLPEKKRKISGTNVYIVGGKEGDTNLGKIRLTTSRGVEVTEEVNRSVRTTLQKQLDNVVGKIILSDSEGNELPLIETLLAGINVKNSVRVATKTVACPPEPTEIPGIVPADAFDANDCFGTQFRIKVPKSGIIYGATFFDLDDEGTQVDLEIFNEKIAQVASDSPYAPTDSSILSFVTELQFYAFDDHGTSQTSEVKNFGKAYVCPTGYFWIQAVTRSTPTIAVENLPKVQLFILSDDPDFEA